MGILRPGTQHIIDSMIRILLIQGVTQGRPNFLHAWHQLNFLPDQILPVYFHLVLRIDIEHHQALPQIHPINADGEHQVINLVVRVSENLSLCYGYLGALHCRNLPIFHHVDKVSNKNINEPHHDQEGSYPSTNA
jgi:hypothetical protein